MNNKRMIAAASAAVLMLALAACSGEKPQSAAPSPAASPVPSPSPAVSAGAQTSAPTASPIETASPRVLEGTGTYVGQIDPHSVEIETDEGPTAFQLNEQTMNIPETLNSNDAVVFEYVEEPIEGDATLKQLVLTKLSRAGEGGAPAPTGAPGVGTLPESKLLKVTLEGQEEEKTARLIEGDGYALYAFDLFGFDPASGKLMLKADENYYAEITKLPSDYSWDNLFQEAKDELAATGAPVERKKADIPETLTGASLYMTAENDSLVREYIVKEFDGQGYIFRLNIPKGEPAEGFYPHVLASLGSIVNR